MTNTTYFYNTIRDPDSDTDDGSVSASSPELQCAAAGEAKLEALSVYSIIGKACLACARPPPQVTDCNSTTVTHKTDSTTPTSQTEGEKFRCSPFKSFSFAELVTATDGFERSDALAGSFGSVFKGWINKDAPTAIKRGNDICIAVKLLNEKGFQNHLKWLRRLNDMGKLYHPNLVRLFGYCLEDKHWALVSEFMPQGSLEDHLLGRDAGRMRLPWSMCMKIALGTAQGLAFLHSAEVSIVHGNFRPSNILLDENYNAKLTDFGLTRDGLTNHPVGIMETVGGPDLGYCSDSVIIYDAPEYRNTGQLSTETDVYSFGVVLLKMLYGQRAMKNFWQSGKTNLAEWAKAYLERKMFPTTGNGREDQYLSIGAQKVPMLVIQCLSSDAQFRPNMDEVVETLRELQSIKAQKCSK